MHSAIRKMTMVTAIAIVGAIFAVNMYSSNEAHSATASSPTCSQAIDQANARFGNLPFLGCAKAHVMLGIPQFKAVANANSQSRDTEAALAVGNPPGPIAEPFYARTVLTDQSVIQDMADPGFVASAVWQDDEANYLVQVMTESPVGSPNVDYLSVSVINESDQTGPGSIDGYSGGMYPIPAEIGASILENVSGSLAAGGLNIGISGANGTGSFDTATPTIVTVSGNG